MSFANKFLGTGEIDVTNGTIALYGSKIGAKDLINETTDTVKINANGCLFASQIQASDIAGVLTNPLTVDLDVNSNNIINTNTIEIDNGANSATINYSTGISDVNVDVQTILDIDDVTQNMNLTTTSGQTDIDGDVVVDGDLQFGGALIGDLVINDVVITSQTNDLGVSVSNNTDPSTAANQTTGNSSLSSINGKIPAIGPQVRAASSCVTLATDELDVNVNIAAQDADVNANITNTAVNVTSNGANLASNATLVAFNNKFSANGPQTALNSRCVTLATDEADVDVNITNTNVQVQSNSLPIATEATLSAFNGKFSANGGQTSANSRSVTLATDEADVDVNITNTNVQVQSNSLPIATEATLSAFNGKFSANGGQTVANSRSVTLATDEPDLGVSVNNEVSTDIVAVSGVSTFDNRIATKTPYSLYSLAFDGFDKRPRDWQEEEGTGMTSSAIVRSLLITVAAGASDLYKGADKHKILMRGIMSRVEFTILPDITLAGGYQSSDVIDIGLATTFASPDEEIFFRIRGNDTYEFRIRSEGVDTTVTNASFNLQTTILSDNNNICVFGIEVSNDVIRLYEKISGAPRYLHETFANSISTGWPTYHSLQPTIIVLSSGGSPAYGVKLYNYQITAEYEPHPVYRPFSHAITSTIAVGASVYFGAAGLQYKAGTDTTIRKVFITSAEVLIDSASDEGIIRVQRNPTMSSPDFTNSYTDSVCNYLIGDPANSDVTADGDLLYSVIVRIAESGRIVFENPIEVFIGETVVVTYFGIAAQSVLTALNWVEE